MIPARFEGIVFGLVLSGLMSFLVSGIATFRVTGAVEGFLGLCVAAWLPSWGVAFPAVLVVAPITRRLVQKIVRKH